MSRKLFWLIAAAFALRLMTAVAVARVELFPSYYGSDPARYVERAGEIAAAWKRGESIAFVESFGHRNYERVLAGLFIIFGSSPWVAAVFNCLLGAASLIWIWRIAGRLGLNPRWLPAALFAFWPSAVFWSSQNFRDPLITFLFLGFVDRLAAWAEEGKLPQFGWAGLFLLASSLFRPEMLAAGAVAIFAASVFLWIGGRRREAAGSAASVLVLLALAYFSSPALSYMASGQAGLEGKSIPEAIQVMRANIFHGQFHASGSAILPGFEFRTWWDVARFLPQAVWHVLLQPLPGFYPLGQNPARWAAAVENTFFAFVLIWAVGSLFRRREERGVLLLTVVAASLVILASFLEPDLGTAMRHKYTLFPFVFLLAYVPTAR